MKKTKRLVLLAMLTAVAMILSYVESLLPSVAIPGVKMGLANIAVIFGALPLRLEGGGGPPRLCASCL